MVPKKNLDGYEHVLIPGTVRPDIELVCSTCGARVGRTDIHDAWHVKLKDKDTP